MMTIAELIAFCKEYQVILGILFSGSGVVFATWVYRKFIKSETSSPQPSISVGRNAENIAQGITNSTVTFGDSVDQRGQTISVQNNANTIHYGIPFEQYAADLAAKEKEIRQLLVNAALGDREKQDLENELAKVEKLRLDEQSSYQAHIKDLEERIARLDQLTGKIPDQLIEEAKQVLIKGDKHQAENLFEQVKDQASSHIMAAAEAEYQLGKLAEDDIRYREAYQHFQRANQLTPDNTTFLNSAGLTATTLGEHKKAIEYFELALASDLKTFGEDHPNVAIRRNNLGLAWRSLGENKKAIEYFELALASDLKTFGEDHPDVATDRNNLGLAWHSLGEYKKAIEYIELALEVLEGLLGPDHPNTKTVAANLESAQAELLTKK